MWAMEITKLPIGEKKLVSQSNKSYIILKATLITIFEFLQKFITH